MAQRSKGNDSKFTYYCKNIVAVLIPRTFYRAYRNRLIKSLDEYDHETIISRVNYYNKLNEPFEISDDALTAGGFSDLQRSAYYFDLQRYLKCYPGRFRFSSIFGDVTNIPDSPAFVKSRPICDENPCSVLLKLNRNRHFVFVNDLIPYEQKESRAVWRGSVYREPRTSFIQKYYDHPLCDVGQTNTRAMNVPWQKPYMTREQQLKYKFVLSVEGNDVATNLKWIMSSQSLCFMCQPRYETWFMEGRLIPDFHYVQLKNDYSDIEEKIDYYSRNTQEAKEIIRNANSYVEQFRQSRQEDLISLLVLDKYFQLSGQLET